MKNWLLFIALFLVLTSVACSKKSETNVESTPTSVSFPEAPREKQGLFEKTGEKIDQGIQKSGEKIDQGLKSTGEHIEKGLNDAGEKVNDATQ
jgi:hypothetical protein